MLFMTEQMVMLSGETAQGKYPAEALQMMVHIIENTEQHLDYDMILDKAGDHLKRGISSAIGYSSVLAAESESKSNHYTDSFRSDSKSDVKLKTNPADHRSDSE